MKHNIKITVILLGMFLFTQFIGLYVVNSYSQTKVIQGQEAQIIDVPALPYGMENQEMEKEDPYKLFYSLVIAFIIAISLLFFLTKFNAHFIIKLWFFLVVTIALGITLNLFIPFQYSSLIAILISAPLAFIKIYRQNFLVHNLTELLIYPGIAAVFVPILNFKTMIILLIIISVYDMWAVWHSGIMQKMAKYQIQKLNIFGGFFVPYASKKMREKINLLQQRFASKKISRKQMEKQRIKVNVAILGGGDVVFPILTSGVMLKTGFINLPFGLKPFVGGFTSLFGIIFPWASLFVILGATLGLFGLFLISQKKKFYPAMPFITLGIFFGLIINWALQ